MTGLSIFRLYDRDEQGDAPQRGLSCDEEGVFLAGDIPIVSSDNDGNGNRVYRARYIGEINFLLSAALGVASTCPIARASFNSSPDI